MVSYTVSAVLAVLLVTETFSINHKDWLTLRTERAYKLSSFKQLITSSTLSWARIEDILSGKIPTDRLVLVGSSAVCRVRDGNRQRAGRTDLSGSCLAGPGWSKHADYQVLVDPTSLARFEWMYWDMYTLPQIGTVAYNSHSYVGRFQMEPENHIIGELDFSRGLNGNIKAYVSEKKTEMSVQGSALVEVDPIKYKIDSVELLKARARSTEQEVVLGKVVLSRPPSENEVWEYVEDSLEYAVEVSQAWGHIPGTIKGLPAESVLFNRSVQFSWGIPWSGVQEGTHSFGTNLLPGTQMETVVKGVIKRGETSFTANLTQFYADGGTRSTRVKGTLSHRSLLRITEDRGRPYYTESGLPAPQFTEPSPTTTTSVPASEPGEVTNPTQDGDNAGKAVQLTGSPATLYPPTQSTTRKPNPLRRFYPEEDDMSEKDAIQAAKFSDKESQINGSSFTQPSCILLLLYIYSIQKVHLYIL